MNGRACPSTVGDPGDGPLGLRAERPERLHAEQRDGLHDDARVEQPRRARCVPEPRTEPLGSLPARVVLVERERADVHFAPLHPRGAVELPELEVGVAVVELLAVELDARRVDAGADVDEPAAARVLGPAHREVDRRAGRERRVDVVEPRVVVELPDRRESRAGPWRSSWRRRRAPSSPCRRTRGAPAASRRRSSPSAPSRS